ncbi:MAG: family 20 glycosylhydrolase [Bacteroidetes bacterium]|nr:family 20 glycosylhydrolase [Bacteroidota bacterium]MBS1758231.1 family 20 glycosylhydrolase [Bacteroidota bacterium]
MKKIIFLVAMSLYGRAFCQVNIVPMPAEVNLHTGEFTITPSTKIIVEGTNLEKTAEYFNTYLKKNYGFVLAVQKNGPEANSIFLNYDKLNDAIKGAYNMEISKSHININGDNEEGVFYGMQSLLQLLPAKKSNALAVPQLSIKDYPRFGYRGVHLDVSRHFFTVEEIKRYIDYLATYKFNTFHWHLTDDQGWRIEIKKYPLLTSVGAYRNGTIIGRYPGTGNDNKHYGGFYTQAQIKDVVKYAADRYIDVIPEIEMPGHASAAIAAYPQLSCFPDEDTEVPKGTVWNGPTKGKQVQQTFGVFNDVFAPTDYTFNFLQDVIDEVITLFPSKYIHIGGDECPKENWKRSAFCQQLIKENNLKDEHGLQSYFIQHMEKYINSKGKKIIGWDEILEGGLAPNATVMSWRGEEGGIAAAKDKHDVIMTPGGWCYFDHSQSKYEDSVTIGGYLPIDKVYGYEPIPASLSADEDKYVLGAQANVWTEYIGNEKKLEYMLFPRLTALAEVLWTPKEKRSWPDFEKRLPGIFKKLDFLHINYSPAYYNLQANILPANNNNGIMAALKSNVKAALIKYTLEPGTATKTYGQPIPINKNVKKIVAYSVVNGKKTPAIIQSISINEATGKKITLASPPSSSYSGNGPFTLVDGIQNQKGLQRSNELLGFNGNDLEAVIDLGKTTPIHEMSLHVVQQPGSWVYPPASVSFYTSSDGENFTLLQTVTNSSTAQNIVFSTQMAASAKYVKVWAKNAGIIPSGKEGAGNPAWLFADEIEIK